MLIQLYIDLIFIWLNLKIFLENYRKFWEIFKNLRNVGGYVDMFVKYEKIKIITLIMNVLEGAI